MTATVTTQMIEALTADQREEFWKAHSIASATFAIGAYGELRPLVVEGLEAAFRETIAADYERIVGNASHFPS